MPRKTVLLFAVLAATVSFSAQSMAPDLADEPSLGERKPVERVCRHSSGDVRLALSLPGTAWLQRDTGPRAVTYRLPMDVLEMEAVLDRLQQDFVNLAELGDDAIGSRVTTEEGGLICELRFYDHGAVTAIQFTGLDTLSPALANVNSTLDRLAERVMASPLPTWDLAELEIGDLLRRRSDGILFEYYIDTGDGLGAELHGINQPLVVLETAAELPRLYDRLGPSATRPGY